MLRDAGQEFTLLLNEKNEYELVPYDRIANVANESKEVIAFIFKRNNDLYVVYWHISTDKKLELPLHPGDFVLLEKIGREIQVIAGQNGDKAILPAGNRRYLKTGKLNREQLIAAFRNARILD